MIEFFYTCADAGVLKPHVVATDFPLSLDIERNHEEEVLLQDFKTKKVQPIDENLGVISLHTPITENHHLFSHQIFVRQIYPKLYQEIMSKKKLKTVLTGNPGIGKSAFQW